MKPAQPNSRIVETNILRENGKTMGSKMQKQWLRKWVGNFFLHFPWVLAGFGPPDPFWDPGPIFGPILVPTLGINV